VKKKNVEQKSVGKRKRRVGKLIPESHFQREIGKKKKKKVGVTPMICMLQRFIMVVTMGD
jgi:hypothetical protein